MIRFRIGQRWKRERTASPVDAFGLELDGVDVLAGAGEEPLLGVVPELIEAIHRLVSGERLAQVSLPEAHLELLLERLDGDVDLEVVSLNRPAKRQRGPVRVELSELREAGLKSARTLMADLREHSPAVAALPELRAMVKAIQALQTKPGATAAEWGAPFREELPPHAELSFAAVLDDKRGRIHDYRARKGSPLGSLLVDGELSLHAGKERLWRADGQPFLMALELSRQAEDLSHAIDAKDRVFKLRPGGAGDELTIAIDRSLLKAGARETPIDPHAFAVAMFELGQSLCAALIKAHKPHAKNPYVQELTARCREGLLHLRAARPSAKPTGPTKRARGKPAQPSEPLVGAGRLRRMRYEQRWSTEPLGLDATSKLLLGRKGPIVSGPEFAVAFTPQGRVRFRHASVRGVAMDEDGFAITATADRILGFAPDRPSASWLRDHDGLQLGPELFREGARWLTASQSRSVLAFDALTGRELWRISPSRTQRSFLTVASGRALLTTDGGYLYGVSLADGNVLYRMRASQPFDAAVVPWGKRLVARVGTSERIAVTCAELETGAIHWSRELSLSRPSQPLPVRDRVFLAGEQGGDALVFCLNRKGDTLWERRLHLGAGPFTLTAVKRSVIATARTGAAALLDSDGRMVWRVGAPTGEDVACDVHAVVARGIAVIPGPTVRAVDVRTGQLLAEVKANAGLCDLKIDRGLGLYLLDEDGTLSAYRLATHLAVLD